MTQSAELSKIEMKKTPQKIDKNIDLQADNQNLYMVSHKCIRDNVKK